MNPDSARYSRQMLVPGMGSSGQKKLADARVLCVGAGGLGSPVALYLVASGVGTVAIVDPDTVELSNLSRQILHREKFLGKPKVVSAHDALSTFNSSTTIVPVLDRITPHNAAEILAPYDIIIDGSDNFATRYLVNDVCAIMDKTYIWGSVFQTMGQMSVCMRDDAGQRHNLRDLFPRNPQGESVAPCSVSGVLSTVCGVVGTLMAGEAVKIITGIAPALVGTLLVYDGLNATVKHITYVPDESRHNITSIDPEASDYQDFAQPDSEVSVTMAEVVSSDCILVDVRGEEELAAHPALPGAHHIPLADVTRSALLASLNGAECDAKQQKIVFYCASGVRSAAAATRAREWGFKQAYSLSGGISSYRAHLDSQCGAPLGQVSMSYR